MSHAKLDNRSKNTGKRFVNLKERWDGHSKALDIQSRNGNHKTSDSTNDRMVLSHAGGHTFHAMIMDDHAWSKRTLNLVPKLPSCPRSHLAKRICDVEASVTTSTRQPRSRTRQLRKNTLTSTTEGAPTTSTTSTTSTRTDAHLLQWQWELMHISNSQLQIYITPTSERINFYMNLISVPPFYKC